MCQLASPQKNEHGGERKLWGGSEVVALGQRGNAENMVHNHIKNALKSLNKLSKYAENNLYIYLIEKRFYGKIHL